MKIKITILQPKWDICVGCEFDNICSYQDSDKSCIGYSPIFINEVKIMKIIPKIIPLKL